ncbi:unnamed protein product [Medioppia subpectinata]|uniref:CUB domain-containing protein n=1 Tax=Medioppia subpectinata TaxID=1979941 RepID=A0A7R9KGP9_9ACAR|nr:unnamed protein product [Medioppia subpectinata]CAG2103080.1 unnamed protein product [Medioppia subpectinata]
MKDVLAIYDECNRTLDVHEYEVLSPNYPDHYDNNLNCYWHLKVAQSDRCGGQLDETETAVFSPNYPGHYPDNITCLWNITVPVGKYIVLDVPEFNTEHGRDIVTVYTEAEYVHSYGGVIPVQRSHLATWSGQVGHLSPVHLIEYKAKSMGLPLDAYISAPNVILNTNNTSHHHIYHTSALVHIIDIQTNIMIYFTPDLNQITVRKLATNVLGNRERRYRIPPGAQHHHMAIDWDHKLVYWIDTSDTTIKVLPYEHNPKNLVYTVGNLTDQGDDNRPLSLVFNAMEGRLVWSNVGDRPSIMTANPDGSNRRVLYNSAIIDDNRHPLERHLQYIMGHKSGRDEPIQASHLTIAYHERNYYFVDIADHSLYSLDFGGHRLELYIKSRPFFGEINSMQMVDEDLYLACQHMVYRLPELWERFTKAEVLAKVNHGDMPFIANSSDVYFEYKPLVIDRDRINGFMLAKHPPAVRNVWTNCRHNNCSHLCLASGGHTGYRCLCPTGTGLSSVNQRKCIAINSNISKVSDRMYGTRGHQTANTLLIVMIIISLMLYIISYKISDLRNGVKVKRKNTFRKTRLRLILDNQMGGHVTGSGGNSTVDVADDDELL